MTAGRRTELFLRSTPNLRSCSYLVLKLSKSFHVKFYQHNCLSFKWIIRSALPSQVVHFRELQAHHSGVFKTGRFMCLLDKQGGGDRQHCDVRASPATSSRAHHTEFTFPCKIWVLPHVARAPHYHHLPGAKAS